jgi:hypothetical protein
MCDGFLNKKNHNGCHDCPYHHPERKRPNVPKFARKKMVKFDAFPCRVSGPGTAIRVQIFLPEVFFYY